MNETTITSSEEVMNASHPQSTSALGLLRPRLFAALVLACLAMPRAASATTLTAISSFGTNPGNLAMYKYIPAGLPADAPLIVVLHGCTQTAQAYASSSGWHKMADEHGFALVFPEQKTSNNSNRCFNWFEPGDYTRGQGEARSIISMVDHMVSVHSVDTDRIFVTGLSAGGGMTTVMLAAYPEVFAGGAIMAGLPYRCANSVSTGFTCMSGVNKTPSEWGNLVRGASSHAGPWPVVSIWQGTSDSTVNASNMTELLEQWTDVQGVDRTADATSTVGSATAKQYRNAGGKVVVETWSISGMGHATAVDPGSTAAQCGTTGQYFVDANVCSSYYAALHWGIIATAGGGGGTGGTGGTGGSGGTGGGHQCTEHTDNNYNQVQAGRAYTVNLSYVYANGSNEYMGLYNLFTTNTLAQVSPGFYVIGSCP